MTDSSSLYEIQGGRRKDTDQHNIKMSDDKKRDEYDMELGEKSGKDFDAPSPPSQTRYHPPPSTPLSNNPILPILSYCASSILMTVTNKYVLSGTDYNLNFFLLCVQVRTKPS